MQDPLQRPSRTSPFGVAEPEVQRSQAPTLRVLAVLDCFLVLGVFGVYLKISMLDLQWGAIARFLGKLHGHDVTLLERLGFFGPDIVLNLIVIPLAGTLLLCTLLRRRCVGVAAATCLVMATAYFFEFRAQLEVGQYVSRDLLLDSLRWSVANPDMIRDYVTLSSMLKFGLLAATLGAIVVIASLHGRAENRQRWQAARGWRLLLALPALGVLLAAATLAPVSYATSTSSPLSASATGRVMQALLASQPDHDPAPLNLDQALQASRKLTNTPEFDAANPLIGREGDSDVLVFLMETGPARALDLAASARSLPGAGTLVEHAFIGTQHYTTYPYTSDAVFSMLSGLYPEGRRRILRHAATDARPLNGLMSALSRRFPMRRVYVPSLYYAEVDDAMYAAFGAETLYTADEHPDDPLRQAGEQRAAALLAELEHAGGTFTPAERTLLHTKLRADLQALERMKADIADAVQAGHRYCVAYMPQIGHGPWIALHGEPSVVERGHALMLLQDAWIKELTDLLRSLGRLDHTVFVVTADHGIRTRAEDPDLPIGRISDYMFRVPLLIHAPNALHETRIVDVPTSHIDLAPTLLALAGETEGIAHMQGIPIWQRSTHDRIYFWASAYGGADGFTQDGLFYMRQALSGDVFRSPRFEFSDASLLPADDPTAVFVKDSLGSAIRIQQSVATQVTRLAQ